MNARRAPVQGDHDKVRRARIGKQSHPPGSIEWNEHERAWLKYASLYGRSQSAERIAERGGFGFDELIELLGHDPQTWEPNG
jgi:hypothetical protein